MWLALKICKYLGNPINSVLSCTTVHPALPVDCRRGASYSERLWRNAGCWSVWHGIQLCSLKNLDQVRGLDSESSMGDYIPFFKIKDALFLLGLMIVLMEKLRDYHKPMHWIAPPPPQVWRCTRSFCCHHFDTEILLDRKSKNRSSHNPSSERPCALESWRFLAIRLFYYYSFFVTDGETGTSIPASRQLNRCKHGISELDAPVKPYPHSPPFKISDHKAELFPWNYKNHQPGSPQCAPGKLYKEKDNNPKSI